MDLKRRAILGSGAALAVTGLPRLALAQEVTSILTTSHGVMTGRAAKKAGVGGEVLCNVW